MEQPIHRTTTESGSVVVTVLGEIDYSNADEVAEGIRDAVAESAASGVTIDLRSATFIDSTGLGALIEGYRAAAASGSRFTVVNPTESFRRVLTVTGLCELFGLSEEAPADVAM